MDAPLWVRSLLPVGDCCLAPMKNGSNVVCWHAFLEFKRHDPQPSRKERYGKPAITLNQLLTTTWKLSWAVPEIVLVQRTRDAGWMAGWVDAYGQAPDHFKEWIVSELPPSLQDDYDAITIAANKECCPKNGKSRQHRHGRPDIIAWKGESPSFADALFIEYKGPRDRVSAEQIEWFRAGMAKSSRDRFVIAHWQEKRVLKK